MERRGVWLQKWGWWAGFGVGTALLVWKRDNPFCWGFMLLVLFEWLKQNLDQRQREKAWAAAGLALPMLDVFGKYGRIMGTDSELVDTRHIPRQHSYADGWGYGEFEQLCRTRSGQWFRLSFHTSHGKPHDLRVERLTGDEVQTWLVRCQDIEKYSKYFGKPDVL